MSYYCNECEKIFCFCTKSIQKHKIIENSFIKIYFNENPISLTCNEEISTGTPLSINSSTAKATTNKRKKKWRRRLSWNL